MSLIQVSNLSFTYDGSFQPVFENVNMQLDTAWRLGFIGRNGRGKTTFLKLLLGELHYQGSIHASVGFSYFPYPVKDSSQLALSVLESICPDFLYWQLLREMNLLGVPEEILYQPYNTLSNGEQTKLQLAVLFLRENQFLLIDEPTNHLDMLGRTLVSRYLRTKSGFILVSHDRAFLDGCVDHILSINKANIEVQKGNYSSWWENKQRQDAFELEENRKLQKEITRLQETAREKAQWSDRVEATKIGQGPCDRGYIGHKAAKMMARSKAIAGRREAAIAEKSKLLKNIERADSLKIFQLPYHQSTLVRLQNVTISYGERTVCRDISFEIRPGDRICLQGPNGSGKSSLLRLILGEAIPHTGEVRIGSGVRLSYVSQSTQGLGGSLRDLARDQGVEESLLLSMLAKLGMTKAQTEKDLESLSDGQKKKVLLAVSICQKTHLHIWDEPLNFMDVISRTQLEELLLTCKPTILFVEHDKMFCEHIANKTVTLG